MSTPTPKESTQRVRALQQMLLHELTLGPRTTRQLSAALRREEDQTVYRALLALEEEGRVTSFADRRGVVAGRIGRVWSLPVVQPAPGRDPLVAALFGDAPRRAP